MFTYKYLPARAYAATVAQTISGEGWPKYNNGYQSSSPLTADLSDADVTEDWVITCSYELALSGPTYGTNSYKYGWIWAYPIAADGTVTNPTTRISVYQTNSGGATSWVVPFAVSARPNTKDTIAVARFSGVDTFNSFFNSYTSTYSSYSGAIMYKANPSDTNWTTVNVPAIWQGKCYWDPSGTYIAGTSSTSRTQFRTLSLLTWSGTAVAQHTTLATPTVGGVQLDVFNMGWLGNDYLLVAFKNHSASGIDMTENPHLFGLYRRLGGSLTQVVAPMALPLNGYDAVGRVHNLLPYGISNRAVIGVQKGFTTGNFDMLDISYNGSTLIGTPVYGRTKQFQSGTTSFARFMSGPYGSNKMFVVPQTGTKCDMFSISESGPALTEFISPDISSRRMVGTAKHTLSGKMVLFYEGFFTVSNLG